MESDLEKSGNGGLRGEKKSIENDRRNGKEISLSAEKGEQRIDSIGVWMCWRNGINRLIQE